MFHFTALATSLWTVNDFLSFRLNAWMYSTLDPRFVLVFLSLVTSYPGRYRWSFPNPITQNGVGTIQTGGITSLLSCTCSSASSTSWTTPVLLLCIPPRRPSLSPPSPHSCIVLGTQIVLEHFSLPNHFGGKQVLADMGCLMKDGFMDTPCAEMLTASRCCTYIRWKRPRHFSVHWRKWDNRSVTMESSVPKVARHEVGDVGGESLYFWKPNRDTLNVQGLLGIISIHGHDKYLCCLHSVIERNQIGLRIQEMPCIRL